MRFEKGNKYATRDNRKKRLPLREMCRALTTESIAALEKAVKSDDLKIAVNAAVILLDRGWGKPGIEGTEQLMAAQLEKLFLELEKMRADIQKVDNTAELTDAKSVIDKHRQLFGEAKIYSESKPAEPTNVPSN